MVDVICDIDILIECREITMNGFGSNGNMYSTPISYGIMAPLSGTVMATETVVPVYRSAINESIPVSKKRSRDVLLSPFPIVVQNQNQNQNGSCASCTFLGEDNSFQIQQQSLEIDRLISQHVRF